MIFTPRSWSLVFAAALIFVVQTGDAAEATTFKLASIFGDNMVLQQNQSLPVWGWAAPGSSVKVTFSGQTKSTSAGAAGRWEIRLRRLKASRVPENLTVEVLDKTGNKNLICYTNILVGEVWLCSGQSNMEKPIGHQPGQKPVFNAEQELAAAKYPEIRIFQVEKTLSATPLNDLEKFHGWQECNSNALNSISFSAAAYFFGREIHTNLDEPVGLIESSWGGTRIEPWTPPAGFEMIPSLTSLVAQPTSTNKLSNTRPMAIYNAMIAPIAGFAIRGVLWYQGESNLMVGTNSTEYLDYADRMAALVGGWRQIWDAGDFPFYFVQIAPFKYHSGKIVRVPSADSLPEFWTIQSRAARRIKNSGLVVTTDLVDNLNDIHPRNKQDVGHRLALLALNKTYGDRNLTCSGPVFRKMKICGTRAILKFDNTDGGLMSRDGQPLNWFTIAGINGKFIPAVAKIVGDTVEVSTDGIEKPVVVRFAWDETAQPNFCNRAGLPAEPFRTDEPTK